MSQFCRKFGVVFWVPGNHELWLRRDGSEGTDSFEKLARLEQLCACICTACALPTHYLYTGYTLPLHYLCTARPHCMHSCDRLGVVTSPQHVQLRGGAAVRVCPLLSVHHTSFDTEPDIASLRLPKVRARAVRAVHTRLPGPPDSVAAVATSGGPSHFLPLLILPPLLLLPLVLLLLLGCVVMSDFLIRCAR